MITEFKTIEAEALERNPFTLFAKGWPILTAGHLDNYNGMTIGWGGLGTLWRRKVVTVYVRPQRYTYRFVESEPYFSLSILDESHKDALSFFGTNSGRNVDKAKETGLTPVAFEDKTVYFAESKLVLVLKKIYSDDLDKSRFVGLDPNEFYQAPGDTHRVYIGEIVSILQKA